MAGLFENPVWEDEVYQLEQTDPVLGGPPDLAQAKGFTNEPHRALANRTAWLKAEVAALAASSVTQADIDATAAILSGDITTLEGNIPSIIRNEMHFSATVDPDEANPTEVEGGTFNTVVAAVEAAPAGSFAQIKLLADKTYVMDTNIRQNNVATQLVKEGGGANPILDVRAVATATFNSLVGFTQNGLSSLETVDVDIQLPAALPDPSLPLSSSDSLLRYSPGGEISLTMQRGTITGGALFGLCSAHAGTIAKLSLFNVTLDGTIYGVTSAANGVSLVCPYTTTLLNGATLTEGGVIGTNVLQS